MLPTRGDDCRLQTRLQRRTQHHSTLLSTFAMAIYKIIAATTLATLAATHKFAAAFHTVQRPIISRPNKVLFVPPVALANSQDDDSPVNNEDAPQKYSVARVGGRKTKKNHQIKKDTSKNTNSGVFATIRQLALPILLATVFFRLLFGNLFSGSSPNVVYYSSSVYQSTTYKADGNVETSRKESFESNIPGLVEKARRENSQRNDNRAIRGSYYDIDSAIEDELMDVEEEINSIFGKW